MSVFSSVEYHHDLIRVLGGLNNMIYVNHLAHYLEHCMHSIFNRGRWSLTYQWAAMSQQLGEIYRDPSDIGDLL